MLPIESPPPSSGTHAFDEVGDVILGVNHPHPPPPPWTSSTLTHLDKTPNAPRGPEPQCDLALSPDVRRHPHTPRPHTCMLSLKSPPSEWIAPPHPRRLRTDRDTPPPPVRTPPPHHAP